MDPHPYPDPIVRGTNLRSRIHMRNRTNMLWIRNTGAKKSYNIFINKTSSVWYVVFDERILLSFLNAE